MIFRNWYDLLTVHFIHASKHIITGETDFLRYAGFLQTFGRNSARLIHVCEIFGLSQLIKEEFLADVELIQWNDISLLSHPNEMWQFREESVSDLYR